MKKIFGNFIKMMRRNYISEEDGDKNYCKYSKEYKHYKNVDSYNRKPVWKSPVWK